jgi:hypothetical protein
VRFDQSGKFDNFVNKPKLVNMKSPVLHQVLSDLPGRLEALLDVPVRSSNAPGPVDSGWDAEITAGDWHFLVKAKAQGTPIAVRSAIAQIQQGVPLTDPMSLPLVVVPFMGELGAEACKKADVSWLDLSGNGWIKGTGLRIRVEGIPNQYRKRGRTSNPFAPQASRLTRFLLINSDRAFSQQELKERLVLDPGYLSRLIKRMCAEGLLRKDASGRIRVEQPDLLLDVWRDGYHIQEYERIQGHLPARSGEHALEQLVQRLDKLPFIYAVTGLAAAWIHTGFAGFRLVSLYMDPTPGWNLERELGFEQTDRGANLWIIRAKDDGVYEGQTQVNRANVVHPLQAYMDLKDHPERASEAAANLRERFLTWGRHA